MAKRARALDVRFREVLAVLSHSRIPYMVIGAFALPAWGRPRATLDFDLMIQTPVIPSNLLRNLAATGFLLDEEWSEHNPLRRGSQERLRSGSLIVDLLAPRDEHDRHALTRRKKKLFRGKFWWLVSPEDLLIQKLKAGRPQDFADAAGIIERMGHQLDRRYLMRWAEKSAVVEELVHVFSARRV